MAIRSLAWCAAAGWLTLVCGCLHPVREKVDSTVCDLSARPRDVELGRPEGLPPIMPPAQGARIADLAIEPAVYREPAPDPRAPLAGSGPGTRLTIPPGLPGAQAPPIVLPPLTPENEAKRREAIGKLYPALEALGNDPVAAPAPDGQPYTLADLQRLALSNSPLIRQAAANVEAARGAAIQAGLYPNPQVGYEQDTIYTTNSPGYLGGFFDQKIVTGSKLQLARAAATMDLKNAELALRRAETDLMSKVRGGYYAVLVAQENMRVSKDLVRFTGDIYQIQVDQVRKGGFAAPYEPLQLRALAVQARAALVQARNRYTSAWKQLASTLGLPALPPTALAGRVDGAMPVFDHDRALQHVLRNHTDVLTAENTFLKSQYNLRLARQTPISDVNVRLLLQKDYTGPPNNINPSLQVYFPLPVWDRNQGGIIQAQGALVNASEEAHRVRDDLTARLADAFERYSSNRVLLGYYRDQILPDLVRAYRGIYQRYQTEVAPGAIAPPGTPSPPQYGDVVVAQQNLAAAVVVYLATLGQAWQAVLDVADLLQTDDLYHVGTETVATECLTLPALPCDHPCSPRQEPGLKGAHGDWPPPTSGKDEAPMPPADEVPAPKTQPTREPEAVRLKQLPDLPRP